MPLDPRRPLSSADRVRLTSELAAPYRGLRKFVYLAVGTSCGLGAFVFGMRALAGRDLETTLPNLALQVGILALAVFLFRIEGKAQDKVRDRVRKRLDRDPS
ncbi:MAG: DUF3493 domain-containing protein [Synechococcaceae cyanobacterium SM2_3_1]|nr:DUF3493 domain-containing protein [Synechococcaceae cyanobacterium SM2_3_1]